MFTWQFRTKKDKNPSWYMFAVVGALALIIWGYVMGLYIMSIVVFILVGVYMLLENNTPDIASVHVSDTGIQIGTDFYDFGKIETFTIFYQEAIAVMLRLKMNKGGFRVLDLPIPRDIHGGALREWLAQYIQEDSQSELSKTDKLIEFLKI